jgi:phosphopantothenoylcysteine decarboxylase/phosphopantothenate--cysteine ligase
MVTILLTAGPTREHLDDVRFLSNGSTGSMGYALAAAAAAAGHDVHLVSGPTALPTPPGVHRTSVTSALEMLGAVEARFDDADLLIAVAAVADHRPAQRAAGKPPKSDARLVLELVRNPDVVATVAARKEHRVVVGFALESFDPRAPDAALQRATAKLQAKHLDLIVLNPLTALGDPAAGGSAAAPIWLVHRDGRVVPLTPTDKSAAARDVLDAALALLPGTGAGGSA